MSPPTSPLCPAPLRAVWGMCRGERSPLGLAEPVFDLSQTFFFLTPAVSRGSRPPLSFKEAGGKVGGREEGKVPVSLLPILILRISVLGQSRVFPLLFRAARPRPSNSIICAEEKVCVSGGGVWGGVVVHEGGKKLDSV